jgi:D-serine deaminase-like pyridoxal phosphate-dependent protein
MDVRDRYRLNDPDRLLSPSLLIERTLLRRNLETMIRLARDPRRLRPHVKTHKMAAIVRMGESMGIRKHKCATIAEAEMVAAAGGEGTDVLLAYPVVGPNLARLARLLRAFPATTFRALVDDHDAAVRLSGAMGEAGRPLSVLIDLDVGMGRTGIAPDDSAVALATRVARLPNLTLDGLSAYDGHIHDTDVEARRKAVTVGLERTMALRDRLVALGLPVPRLVMGGTPTFPIHAALDESGFEVECSPGTCTLHDVSYATRYPDLPFTPAAFLLGRVISRPRPDRLCLDLGHKSVAADPPAGNRLTLLDIPDATPGVHSEEHLVVETPHAGDFPPGSPVRALPTHVCPTCALHRRAYVIEGGELVDEWEITARDRTLSI